MSSQMLPGRRKSQPRRAGEHGPVGTHGTHGRHPDREQLLRVAEAMRKMHSNPSTQAGPLTEGEKLTMASHAEQIKAIAEKPEAA